MNPHILSPLEKRRILAFVDDEQETQAIRNIRSRARKNWPRLMTDIFVLALFLEKQELADYLNTQDNQEVR